jgi:hypothetical protein
MQQVINPYRCKGSTGLEDWTLAMAGNTCSRCRGVLCPCTTPMWEQFHPHLRGSKATKAQCPSSLLEGQTATPHPVWHFSGALGRTHPMRLPRSMDVLQTALAQRPTQPALPWEASSSAGIIYQLPAHLGHFYQRAWVGASYHLAMLSD